MMGAPFNLITFALVAAICIGTQTARRVGYHRNRVPTIQSFTSSLNEIDYCPFFKGLSCSSPSTIVELTVKASDPDGDQLTYKYSVSAGVIGGTGASVTWDLYKTPFTIQTATVEVKDQRGGKAVAIVRVNVIVCGACDPPCSTLTVTCPTEVTEGDIALWTATVGGSDPDRKLTYLWSHSNGKRIDGQAGPELRIKALGLPGDMITATVNVLGLDPACNHQASCESRIVKASSRSEK